MAQALEAGEVSSDLLEDLQAEIEAVREKPEHGVGVSLIMITGIAPS